MAQLWRDLWLSTYKVLKHNNLEEISSFIVSIIVILYPSRVVSLPQAALPT